MLRTYSVQSRKLKETELVYALPFLLYLVLESDQKLGNNNFAWYRHVL